MSSDVRACVGSRWGPGCWVKGGSGKPGRLLCTQGRALLPQSALFPPPCPPPYPPRPPPACSDFLFLAPGGTLDAPVPPGPWRGSQMRVREESKQEAIHRACARVRPWAREHVSIRSVSGWRGGKWGQEERPFGPRLHSGRCGDAEEALTPCCQVTVVQKLPTGSLKGAD